MCNALAEGGQRCYSHSYKALANALNASEILGLPPEVTWEREALVRTYLVDLASTPKGQEILNAHLASEGELDPVIARALHVSNSPLAVPDEVSGDLKVAAERALEEGKLVAQRNSQIEASVKRQERIARIAHQAKRIAKYFTPAAISVGTTVAAMFTTKNPETLLSSYTLVALAITHAMVRSNNNPSRYLSEREKQMRADVHKEVVKQQKAKREAVQAAKG